jgi:hypothetical protein
MRMTTTMSPANRTGMQRSPMDAEAQMSAPQSLIEPRLIADTDPDLLRAGYVTQAEALGSVPVPGTAKGMAKAGVQALKGNRAQVLMDKLGERLAFERAGTRLYDQMIKKCEALSAAGGDMAMPPLEGLQEIRRDEAAHAALLVDALKSLGGDPTAMTPCGDLVGIEGMGLLQVLSDPRTTPTQGLHALLTAELSDNVGWELLSALARDSGESDLAERFEQAFHHEAEHLARIKAWHTEAVFGETSLLAAAASSIAKTVGGDGAAMAGAGPAIPHAPGARADGVVEGMKH